MRIGKIASSAEYQMDKKFQNFIIFGISIVFQNRKNSENLLIFQVVKFWKFVNFLIYKIPKNFQNYYSRSIIKLHGFSKFNNLEYQEFFLMLLFGKSIFYNIKSY